MWGDRRTLCGFRQFFLTEAWFQGGGHADVVRLHMHIYEVSNGCSILNTLMSKVKREWGCYLGHNVANLSTFTPCNVIAQLLATCGHSICPSYLVTTMKKWDNSSFLSLMSVCFPYDEKWIYFAFVLFPIYLSTMYSSITEHHLFVFVLFRNFIETFLFFSKQKCDF